ncbi:MAG: phosphoribosylformylglycinamidine cyclo-ligase [Bacteroidetes bacterium]|nr:phosphoribosylformylglycinamidine cyclo-ligase [Bacteroidota bacterium]
MSESYLKRGVSASKEDVHNAIKNLSFGLYDKMFCKVYPDFLAGSEDWVSLMSSDGSGTKSILAYMYWRETGDVSVWAGIAQDALVMNLDDMLCVGARGPFLYSSVINRNKNRIPGEVIKAIIEGTQQYIETLHEHGVNIVLTGGETADLGDLVRTITVDGSMVSRMQKKDLIYTHHIQPGHVIVGLASYGKSTYESAYNSGIGSNGLTSARHDLLSKKYAENFPESFEKALDESVVYIGKNKLTDAFERELDLGRALLSPTRSFAPALLQIFDQYFDSIGSIVHNTGGGHTKVHHFAPAVKIIKDNLLPIPAIFSKIQASSNIPWKEMFQMYNMGTRMEIYCDESAAKGMIEIAQSFGIEGQIIGRVEANDKLEIVVTGEAYGTSVYNY